MLTNIGAEKQGLQPHRGWTAKVVVVVMLGLFAQSLGCAHVPPGDNTPSGRRLRVIMTFRGAIDPTSRNLYYFCINKADAAGNPSDVGEQNAPGPIPVGGPISGQTYGNGFATGSMQGKYGFTDFVLFSTNQYSGGAQDGFAIYHVFPPPSTGGSDNPSNFRLTGVPIARVPPTSSIPNTIQFEIDLTQIIRNPDGSAQDLTQAVNLANAIRYLQVNIIATNIAPTEPQTAVNKMFDSFGDNRTTSYNFLTLNFQNTHWDSGQAGSTFEPTDPDVFPFSGTIDPSLDLVSWSIDLVRN